MTNLRKLGKDKDDKDEDKNKNKDEEKDRDDDGRDEKSTDVEDKREGFYYLDDDDFNDRERSCHSMDPDMLYFCPIDRYCDWDYFDDTLKNILKNDLGYTRQSWNYNELVNDIELIKFDDLSNEEQLGLAPFGFDKERHDCCHGHYIGYTWDDFDDFQKQALRDEGIDRRSWEDGYFEMYAKDSWDELPQKIQQIASTHFCYTEEIWDQIPLTKWSLETRLPGSHNPSNFVIPKPPILNPSDLDASIDFNPNNIPSAFSSFDGAGNDLSTEPFGLSKVAQMGVASLVVLFLVKSLAVLPKALGQIFSGGLPGKTGGDGTEFIPPQPQSLGEVVAPNPGYPVVTPIGPSDFGM